MKTLTLGLILTIAIAACNLPMLPGIGRASHTSTTHTQTSELLNGKSIDADDEPAPRATPKKRGGSQPRADFGATCRKNSECAFDACFVGHGNLGYCTKMCNSWSDCPTRWDCKRAGNAPQRICMQDQDDE
jgi:hypothetical protein